MWATLAKGWTHKNLSFLHEGSVGPCQASATGAILWVLKLPCQPPSSLPVCPLLVCCGGFPLLYPLNGKQGCHLQEWSSGYQVGSSRSFLPTSPVSGWLLHSGVSWGAHGQGTLLACNVFCHVMIHHPIKVHVVLQI